MSSGFVYLWFDRKHKRFYVGSHWGSENDGYVCSSTWMLQAYYRRPEDFKRRIIARVSTSRKELLAEELRFLNMIKPEEIKVKYYNLRIRHTGHWSTSSLEPAKKSGESRRGKSLPCSLEKAKRISEAKLAKKHKMSDEAKAKMSESAKARKASEDTKKKLSEAQKLRHQTHQHYTKKSRLGF